MASSPPWPILSLALMAVACSGPQPATPTQLPAQAADRQALLTQVGGQIILPTYRAFVTDADALTAAAGAWSSAQTSGGDVAAARAAAQDAWRQAMATWQRAEVFQVGPAGSSTMFSGGQDLRDEVYSWPTTSPCKVDQVLAEGAYEAADFVAQSFVNAYGLDALEYLLFHSGADNACIDTVYPNKDGDWAALGEAEIDRRRARYAEVAAAALAAAARRLTSAWEPSSGDFLGAFTGAGGEGSPYDSAQDAIDELFAALFYLDLDTKDMKLAEPAGISPECGAATCPDRVECPFSGASSANVAQNVASFAAVYRGVGVDGGDGVGFEDLLLAMEADALAAELSADIDAAQAAAEALPADLAAGVVDQPAAVQGAYDGIKEVTDLLKSQLVTVLNLTIPDEGAGDND